MAPARSASLWLLTVAPAIWAGHFMLSYISAAIWCGRFAGPLDSASTVRAAMAGYTVVALAGIAFVAWIGMRLHRAGSESTPHDADTPEDRSRFIGFSTLLLAGLSAVATIYSALVAVFLETCQ